MEKVVFYLEEEAEPQDLNEPQENPNSGIKVQIAQAHS
jgi:hypothetical protein